MTDDDADAFVMLRQAEIEARLRQLSAEDSDEFDAVALPLVTLCGQVAACMGALLADRAGIAAAAIDTDDDMIKAAAEMSVSLLILLLEFSRQSEG